MASATIGLIGAGNDAQVLRLQEALAAAGAQSVQIDLTEIPAHAAFHWEDGVLRFGAQDLGAIDAWFARAAHFPMPAFVPGQPRDTWEDATFPVRETGSLLNAIVHELARRAPMINPPESFRFHHMKPLMYRTLVDAGVPVPPFAAGCDLAAAAHFVDRHGERVVAKPLMGGKVVHADFAYLRDHHDAVEHRPLLLQRRVYGRSLRAYVVAGRVAAAARIEHGDSVDWREDVREIVPLTLDARAERAVTLATAALGLVFSAVDVEEDGEGPWVIDVNPAPMFAGFELRSGLDVAGPLARALCRAATRGALDPREETCP